MACLVLACCAVPLVAGTAPGADAQITDLAYAGTGNATVPGGGLHLWQSGSHRFTVTVSTESGLDGAQLCLFTRPSGGGDEHALACRAVTVPAETTRTLSVEVGGWSDGPTGPQEVRARLNASNASWSVATDPLALTVIRRAGDPDDDGLSNEREVSLGTDFRSADTDGDGLDDGMEVETHGTNPTNPDTDDDGLDDGLEVNTYDTDPTKVDTDGDGLTDGEEVSEHQTDPTTADTDRDGLDDGAEVNTHETNPTNPDTDDDGLDDGAEVNAHETNPNEADTDGDGRSDREEVDDRRLLPISRSAAAALAVAALALLGGGVLYRSRRPPDTEGTPSDVEGTSPEAGEDDGPAAEPADAPEGEPEPDVPLEFLPNDEQILRILDEHGGRLPQSELVEETGWSKSKVSRVLSEMEADGRIVKVDVGGGNVVARPEDLPSGARSPFDG